MEAVLERAFEARGHTGRWQPVIDKYDFAIFVIGLDGMLKYFNRACAEMVGREPIPGIDRLGPAWRMYHASGELCDSGSGPMSIALRTQEPVRGMAMIGERPDGSRYHFNVYPTPIFSRRTGQFRGVINVMSEIPPERVRRRALRDQALLIEAAIRSADAALAACLRVP